jgi:hypothetical protein
MDINLGRYIISNVSVDLILRIEFINQSVKLSIPLPKNYPQTVIGKSNIVKSDGLFYSWINKLNSESPDWEYFLLSEELFEMIVSNAILLKEFYLVPRDENIYMTPEEEFMLRGLGKRSLCIAFPYIINYLDINPNDTFILLQASGGKIRTESDMARIKQYESLGKDFILTTYRNKYPKSFYEEYEFMIEHKYSDFDLARTLVILENNEKLINYYRIAFGFQSITHISMETKMTTLLSKLLFYCKQ